MTMYSIYSLTEGELGTDTTAETYVEACELYEQAIAHEYALRESIGADYAETTVHLYFPEWGVMEAEAVIERVGIADLDSVTECAGCEDAENAPHAPNCPVAGIGGN